RPSPGPDTFGAAGACWWPRRFTIRRRRCSTRISGGTCPRRTLRRSRRWWSTSTRRAVGSSFARWRRPTTWAGRSTRRPPRDRCTAASTWGSATASPRTAAVARALNPAPAEGQVHGGIHMGLGYALSERLVVERGQVVTQTFMDYAVLKADDMPEIEVRLIETIDAEGPFGAKGLGESGVIPVAA